MAAKQFTRKELEGRNTNADAVFVIDNLVYNVTQFLDEHPGGHGVLLNVSGKDASEDFHDVGHSLDAKEMMKKFLIGEVVDADKVQLKKVEKTWSNVDTKNEAGFMGSWKLPLLVGLLVTVLYSYVLA